MQCCYGMARFEPFISVYLRGLDALYVEHSAVQLVTIARAEAARAQHVQARLDAVQLLGNVLLQIRLILGESF